MPVLNQYRFQCWHGTDVQYRACTDGLLPAKLNFGAAPVVGRTYASTVRTSTANPSAVLAWYQAGCKQGAMPVLDSGYRAEGWRGTGILQPQSWDQVSANNKLRSNASTKPVQISVLGWYRCPVPRQYWWKISNQVTFQSHAGFTSILIFQLH